MKALRFLPLGGRVTSRTPQLQRLPGPDRADEPANRKAWALWGMSGEPEAAGGTAHLESRARRGVAEQSAATAVVIACECGRSACAEVIRLPWSVFEQAKREPRQSLLVPGHELPAIGPALKRYDSYVVVAKGIAEERLFCHTRT